MPFLGNAGQLTHVFVTTLGENSGAGDKSVSIDGAVFASDFKVDSSSLANIAPTLQAVTEQSPISNKTIQLSNPVACIIASGRITADSLAGDGRDITNLSATKLSGIIPHRNFGDNVITGSKLTSKTITTDKIADSSITNEKMADNSVNTAKLVDASITSAKIIDGAITTSKIANTAITTDKIANGSITADKIAQGAIGTAFIGDGNVTTAKIANDAITTSKIADDAVTTSKIPDLSITTAKIADDSVNTAKIADGNVTTIKLADTSITTAKIVNEAITATKIATGTITGTQIEDGSIPLTKLESTDLTVSQIDDNSLSGSKLQRHTITGGDSSLTGNNRGEIGLLTIHNDNIRNNTIDADDKVKDGSVTAAKLNDDVTLSTVTGHGSTTSDAINITNATSSTSKDTGALRVKGGVGVEGNVHATRFIGDGSGLTGLPLTLQEVTAGDSTTDVAINITNATDAVSKVSGALRVKGGVGVEGNVHATRFIGDGSGLTGVPTTLQAVTNDSGNTTSNKINITNATDAISKVSGALRVKGGVGVEGNVHATRFIGDGSGLTGISSTFEAITTGSGNSTSNKILLTNTEDAIDAQTGALQVTNGGMSVAKNVHVGKDLIVTGNLLVNGTTTTVDSTSLIVKDNIISLAEGNDSGSKDVGIIFGRPESNVAIFYDTSTTRLQFGFTDSNASSSSITLKEGDLPIHVAGSVTATTVAATTVGEHYGEIKGSNAIAASTVTATTVGTHYGVISGSNAIAASTVTATTFKGTTVGEHYGVISGSNTIAASTVTATTVGTHYGEIKGSNAIAASTVTATTVGEHYGVIKGSNTIAASTVTATTVGTHYGEIKGSNAIAASTVTATTVGTHYGVISGSNTIAASTGTFTDATDAASNGSAALRTTGGLYVSKKIYAGNDITAFSDRRKKSNITRIENALDKVCQLSGYTFDYLGERKTGVIAQEVKEVLPEAVYGSEDTSYSVAYGNLAGILIEAIKELRNEIQELKNN